ncbi:MAG: thermonuclease family protein [Betaproteobacteria bacterium]
MPRGPWASTLHARPRSWPDARGVGAALALATALAASAASTDASADFTGRIVSVPDGDTLTVLVERQPVRVRLWGIDAPEHGQPWSGRARDSLAARAMHREARVLERGTDGFGRTLARVSVDGVDLAEAQLRDGMAWMFRRYTTDPALAKLENDARTARRGLWSSRDPEPPWRYRDRVDPRAMR